MNTTFATDWTDVEAPLADEPSAPPQPFSFVTRSLTGFYELPIDESKTLLGDRFLCEEGGCLFIGPSGVGKSTASAQQDVLWSLGREAFGIRPARPLKILTIQAENDDGDMTETAKGIFNGLKLTKEAREIVRQNTIYLSHKSTTGFDFIKQVVEPSLDKFKPNLLRLDPLNGYLGGDPSDPKIVTPFLRTWLNPLLAKYRCGLILNHHTPKMINRDTSGWRPSDWSYAGAGNNDITNWARAIIVIDPCRDGRTFKFIASKRGSRLGWKDAVGESTITRHFSHSREHGVIFWTDSTEADVQAVMKENPKSAREPTEQEFLALLPADCPKDNPRLGLLNTNELKLAFKNAGYHKDTLAGLRDRFAAQKVIRVLKGGKNNEILVGRPGVMEAYQCQQPKQES